MQTIGLVGLGFIGKTHLEAYRHIENAKVSAICTRSAVKDQEIINQFDGTFVSDYDDLLRNQDIDIIDICLPTFLHEEYMIKAARAGKHIICEKPLTLTLDSAKRIMEEAEKNGVRLFVGHVLRFWPEYQVIKSYQETGMLKDIKMVHARRLSQVPKWSNWFQYPEKSGGALFDLHIHDIDFLTYLLGEVEFVYAVGSKNRYGAWNHVMTTLSFKDKSKAFAEASQTMPMGYPFTMSFRAQTAESTLDLQVAAGENIENISASLHQFTYYDNGNKSSIDIDYSNPFQNELSYFVNCIESNQENHVVPLEDVLYTLKLLKAIEESLETKKEVRVL